MLIYNPAEKMKSEGSVTMETTHAEERFTPERLQYLNLLSKEYPSVAKTTAAIIWLCLSFFYCSWAMILSWFVRLLHCFPESLQVSAL